MNEAPTLAKGTIIDSRYRVVRRIGEGGMGTVYEAEQLNLRRRVAVKVLRPKLCLDVDNRRRFEREAKVAATLRHPGAVEIHDVRVGRDITYIVMELLTGCELRSLMRDGVALPLADVVAIGAALADVLQAAHASGVVHRDLKPENIFVLDGDLSARAFKVVDFGLAFIEGGEDMGRLTRDGEVAGTPAYVSPEQAMGTEVGPASDVYALGCVLYELATGDPPFVGSWMNVLTQHLHVTPTRPRTVAPEVPGDLDTLLVDMLAKIHSDRPPIADVAVGLAKIQGSLAGVRHRGRSDVLISDRSNRMISVPATPVARTGSAPIAADPELVVGFLGSVSDELAIALASNGLAVAQGRGDDISVDAIVLREGDPSPSKAEAAELPYVAIVDPNAVDDIAQLLRLGVSDVITKPARVDDVVRKVRRAVARQRRRKARGMR